ncbi:hypothetical protein GGX14DRAFT_659990 [Mycena pura]|uniref:Uncharacterized protein n=1 Tax=Mycena pura TaxID=153505 RepID=A0AAD6Y4A9_9AGAR|nr:hypothetical protein GGX14DRAFT_659990 [Mycena pura]
MRSIKNKCGADGSDRVHSLAMSKEYMEKMFAWSDSICAPATYFNPLPSPAESLERMKHLMFKAFVSTGWTVWTRNFELIKLREKDLSFGFEDPRAFNTPRCDCTSANNCLATSRSGAEVVPRTSFEGSNQRPPGYEHVQNMMTAHFPSKPWYH